MRQTKNARRVQRRTRRNIRGGMWPFTSDKKQQPPEPKSHTVFSDPRLSTQPNEDPSYEDGGIIHVTEAVGINFGRAIITNIANTFGSKGIDLSRYNVARTGALKKLLMDTPPGHKVCNIKMDIENGPQSIHVHAYGTLMKPKMTRRMENEYIPSDEPEMNKSPLSIQKEEGIMRPPTISENLPPPTIPENPPMPPVKQI